MPLPSSGNEIDVHISLLSAFIGLKSLAHFLFFRKSYQFICGSYCAK